MNVYYVRMFYVMFDTMDLRPWSEMFENGDQGSTRNFGTSLVSKVLWPGEPLFRK